MMRFLAAAIAAVLMTCAPAAAQNVAKLPAAAALTGAERFGAIQGSGCANLASPCNAVAITPAALAIYLAPTFQAKDGDLDAIAALATVDFGRELLTKADAASVRSAIGVTASGADTAYLWRANNLSGLTNVATARTNLGLATVAATGLDTDLTGAAWTSYTPTITATSGTFTSVSATGRYKRIGKTIVMQIRIAITTNGTAATSIVATLPAAAASTGFSNDGWLLSGRELANNRLVQGFIYSGASAVQITLYNNAYIGSDGQVIFASGTFEAA